jgi:hypothetical protein
MNFISVITAAIMTATSLFGVSPELDASTTGTQTVSGTLSSTLAISISTTGDANGDDEGGVAGQCTNASDFWNETAFGRNASAKSHCTRIEFTAGGELGSNITVATGTNNDCGYMFIDEDSSDGLNNGDTLLRGTGVTMAANECDTADTVVETTANSSLHMRPEALDIDGGQQESDAAGGDCTDVGVKTSAYGASFANTAQDAGTAGSFADDYLVPTTTAAKILDCDQAMFNATFYVEFLVNIGTGVPDGTYEIFLTYTLADNTS